MARAGPPPQRATPRADAAASRAPSRCRAIAARQASRRSAVTTTGSDQVTTTRDPGSGTSFPSQVGSRSARLHLNRSATMGAPVVSESASTPSFTCRAGPCGPSGLRKVDRPLRTAGASDASAALPPCPDEPRMVHPGLRPPVRHRGDEERDERLVPGAGDVGALRSRRPADVLDADGGLEQAPEQSEERGRQPPVEPDERAERRGHGVDPPHERSHGSGDARSHGPDGRCACGLAPPRLC